MTSTRDAQQFARLRAQVIERTSLLAQAHAHVRALEARLDRPCPDCGHHRDDHRKETTP
jgi:hypothetical protein